MYKLMVIAGPARGSSFSIQEGENSIGRQPGNVVTLPSAKVSKCHCVLVVNNGEIVVKDQGSSNGTFVNGVLTKARRIRPGDRISIGEFVLELVDVASRGNVVPFPGTAFPVTGKNPGKSATNADSEAPKDLKSKAIWYFENRVMPIFYDLNRRHEWRAIGIAMLSVFVIGNLLISVEPLLESNRSTVVREAARRASFMAKQIAERNAPFLAASAETKTEVGLAENAEGVRMAVLTDLDSRIIAPVHRLNQYLTVGNEAKYAVKARNKFREGRENGFVGELDSSTVVAIEPVRVASNMAGKNVTVGMAIVSIDTSLSTPDSGEMGMIYSETFILTALLGALIVLVFYRLTTKPFQVLNEEMDKILKGEGTQITRDFKFQELNPLIDLINTALQRVPKNGFGGDVAFDSQVQDDGAGFAQACLGPVQMLGNVANGIKLGIIFCDQDRRIAFINSMFEEISGIRADGALGKEISEVARDQSLGAFIADLFDRCSAGGEGVGEDYDFSGISYKVFASGFLAQAAAPKAYLILVVRIEDTG